MLKKRIEGREQGNWSAAACPIEEQRGGKGAAGGGRES
jgi:hypothetical protein